jgi:RNA polymerase sigma-70 factor (ECF subfamily)
MVEQEQDRIYIKRVLDGDRDAFAFLVDRYQAMVFTLALRMTNDRTEAEEVAQEAFIKAYQSLKSFRGKAKFSSWLYRIVYNTGISHLRKQEKGRVTIDETSIPEELYSESKKNYETLSVEERKKYLEAAMNILDEEERMFIILYYYEERDLDDIAQIAGITKTNTKVRLYRARQKMFRLLGSYLKEEKYSLL